MIRVRIYEKYKGIYVKEFSTEEELDTYIAENYEIYRVDEWIDGKWVEV